MIVLFKFISLQNIFNPLSFFTEYDNEGYLIEEHNENFDEEIYNDDIDDGFSSEGDDSLESNTDKSSEK